MCLLLPIYLCLSLSLCQWLPCALFLSLLLLLARLLHQGICRPIFLAFNVFFTVQRGIAQWGRLYKYVLKIDNLNNIKRKKRNFEK